MAIRYAAHFFSLAVFAVCAAIAAGKGEGYGRMRSVLPLRQNGGGERMEGEEEGNIAGS